MNFDNRCDLDLEEQRKKGYSLKHLLQTRQAYQELEDDLLSLNHCVIICHEIGLPFTKSQIKRVFNQIHRTELHGSKQSCWKFISKFSGSKLIKFRVESVSKVPSLHGENKKLGSLTADNSQGVYLHGLNQISREKTKGEPSSVLQGRASNSLMIGGAQ